MLSSKSPRSTMASEPLPATATLEQQLISLIGERLLETEAGFNIDSNLYEAGLDSMAIMQLLVLVEEEFGFAIPERDLTRHNFSTVRHLAELICERNGPSV
jgi:acyl carrier protein